jgi:hydrogenase maturation protein HypF
MERLRILLGGAVQGVGFRPFVFNLANSLSLKGFVRNDSSGLFIEVEGDLIRDFLEKLDSDPPPAALILTRELSWLAPAGYPSFTILPSESTAKSAAILPDLATCPDCLAEFSTPGQRRHLYPFTNCTRCGPRYTIVLDIPYDRPNTTLRTFPLCPDCTREYRDPSDRRFHAQPIACPVCGPQLSGPLPSAALAAGQIVALKGIGGYQLLVDARNEAAVARLRDRKHREWKPFAVMMPSLVAARDHAIISAVEEALLTSRAAPIVLVKPRRPLAPSVSTVSPYLGIMLPYSPLHHLLLREFPHPVVATSGNLSDEPIAITCEEAHDRLSGIADVFLDHNRPIARPCDDSVTRVLRGRESVLRRARGYAPLPIPIRRDGPRVLAVGGHLKSTVALAFNRQVVVSHHIGDLDTYESRQAFERAIADLCRLYEFTPDVIACDLHPDYFSTTWAEHQGKPLARIQHHMAHAFSCAAENDLDGPYLGVSWDGTGYGLDGAIWGSEMFLIDGPKVARVAHLRPFKLPGGDRAAKDCRLCAQALLEPSPLGHLTTSMGRLFDAVASLLDVTHANRFEGESGLRLEALASDDAAAYPLPQGDWRPLVEALRAERDPARASSRFHNALVKWIVETAVKSGVKQVTLSGGCFQNALLTERACAALEARGLRAFTHQRVPANDGGLSLGQAVAGSMMADIEPLERGIRQSAP